jgi:type 2 lantibiotic biosynthesis protein LanM
MGPNQLNSDALREVVAQASTPFERLNGAFEACSGPGDDPIIDTRFAQWCQVAAAGDAERFARRLAWGGLDETAARRALGPVRLKQESPLPPWAAMLAQLLQELPTSAVPGSDGEIARAGRSADPRVACQPRFLHSEERLPFEEILAPLVAAASRQLGARAGARCEQLSEEALASLERALLRGLCGLCAESLELEFSLFRASQASSLSRLIAGLSDPDSQEFYQAFVTRMLQGRLNAFFQEYCVLARLVGTTSRHWIEMATEFLDRLAADRATIAATFNEGDDPGRIVTLQASISDNHNEGRAAMILQWESGLKLVYKPKDTGLEQAWFDLLGWFNAHGAPLPFQQLKVLDRSTHGWVEFAQHLPCPDEAAARRYYQRCGMLLCLIYALQGNDCHFENIIASGEQPVLIDLETVMHPQAVEPDAATSDFRMAVNREFGSSVLRTALLPRWIPTQEQKAMDVSALGAVEEQEGFTEIAKWRAVNTDQMVLESEMGRMRPGSNAAMLNGTPLLPNDYADDLESGFRQMYRLLMERREALLAPDGPLAPLAEQRVRFIFRATRTYVLVMRKARQPASARNGADHGIQLDHLSRALLFEEEKPLLWPFLEAERQAMERGDVPFFTALAGSEAIEVSPGQVIADCFQGSCHDRALAQIRELNERDLERQTSFIRAALTSRVAAPHQAGMESAPPLEEIEPLPASELVEEAIRLAHQLREEAIGGSDSGVTWVTLRLMFEIQKYQLEVTGPDLYGGGAGIALYLAALEHVTGGAEFRDLALAALEPLRKDLRGAYADRLARDFGIGGASGLGAFVYALTRTGALLGEEALLADARAATALITAERIDADRVYDVIAGSAGTILGLLALHQVAGESEPLERAVECGRHLLEHRTASETGDRAWVTIDGNMLTGFAHGAAGIAYALLRLYGATGEHAFHEAAAEAIRYEQSLYSPEQENWPDLREWKPGEPYSRWGMAWCHGAPGIGLARVAGLPWLDTPEIRADIAVAMRRTRGCGVQRPDHLCCGNLSRAEILLEVGRRLSRPEWIGEAQRRAASVVRRARGNEKYQFVWEIEHLSMPGLFMGASGIGYALLRAAYPERLPAVLLWE